MQPISEAHLIDCMEFMLTIPDKYFELAIVDPPYGIEINKSGRLGHYGGKGKTWDENIPDKSYFEELKRISKNQIIWGGNYFELPPTKCFLIWDKQQPEGVSFASCELAWTNFDLVAKTFYLRPQGQEFRIHPTQKPIALYKWLLKNYAKQGDKILDTHMGSQSSRIACWDGGFDYWGCELDPEYYEQGCTRFNNHIKQLTIAF